jgi:type II secretory pathway predicted ATPase ExeA
MYEKFFGLRERPFDLTPNPRYLVLTDIHREALSNLEYGISSQKGITLLIGEAGSGKTTLIRAAIARQPKRVHCVHLNNPALTRNEFVEMLAARFSLSEPAKASKAVLLLELETLLASRRRDGETTELIVDEAQSLPSELLEEIRLLANIETDSEKLLSVIIAGQPELAERLNDRSLRQLKQRVALRCELRPLTAHETAEYLAGRIRAAGGIGKEVFTRQAVTAIHDRASGIPRTISVIADNALLSGFALQLRPVTSQVVLEVCRDFDLTSESVDDEEPTPPAAMAPASTGAPIIPANVAPATQAASAPTLPGRLLDIVPAGPAANTTDGSDMASTPDPVRAEPTERETAAASAFARLRWFFS